jgi:dTDP-4-amino-4,6-dideoxygalactose transaminase
MPVHLQPAYRGEIAMADSLANTEGAATEVLSLPMYPQLTEEQVRTVAACVGAWNPGLRAVAAR